MSRGSRGWAALLAAAIGAAGCGAAEEYEYEEDVTLRLDGSASVTVNASVPALQALRGIDLALEEGGAGARSVLEPFYDTAVTRLTGVGRPWRRHGRWFVQVEVEVDHVRHLSEAPPFAWSTYAFERLERVFVLRQQVTGSPRVGGDPGWTGEERVAFRYHLPSRIRFHTAPSGALARGNILVWDQSLRRRLEGDPLTIEILMDTTSILSTTLWLFLVAFAAAVLVLASSVWWIKRQGAEADAGSPDRFANRPRPAPRSGGRPRS